MKRQHLIILLSLLFMCSPSSADIYKCMSSGGAVLFSDEPCTEEGVVAIRVPRINVNELVAQASPFKDMDGFSSTVEADLLAHAKKMGTCLFPDERFHSYQSRCSKRGDSIIRDWEYDLQYGPPDKVSKWRVTLMYGVRVQDDISQVWLKEIRVRLWMKYYDLPILAGVDNINQTRTGRWKSTWLESFDHSSKGE